MAKADETIPEKGFSSTVRKIIEAEGYITRIAYNASNQTEYVGKALPGTATSSAGWQIKKLVYSGTLQVAVLFADGDTNFDNVWDNRATLSYS